jgi:hypothetical protein
VFGRLLPSGLLLAAGCARFGYDLTDAPAAGLGGFDALVTAAAGAAGTSALSDAGSAGGAAPRSLDAASSVPTELPPFESDAGGVSGSAGAGGAGGFDAGGPPGPAGGSAGSIGDPPPAACVLRGTETVVQEFDTSSPFVQARGANSTLTWTGAVGNPSPGAYDFVIPAGGTAEIYTASLTGNLGGRHMLLNVYVVAGTNVRTRLFVETGSQPSRGYGEYISAPHAAWNCASLDLQTPAVSDTGFDPRNVSAAGLEVEGSGEVEIYVDQIAY